MKGGVIGFVLGLALGIAGVFFYNHITYKTPEPPLIDQEVIREAILNGDTDSVIDEYLGLEFRKNLEDLAESAADRLTRQILEIVREEIERSIRERVERSLQERGP